MAALPQAVEQGTRHQVHLLRLASGQANQFADYLKRIDTSIRTRLSGEDLTEYSRGRLERLMDGVDGDLRAIYAEHWSELRNSLSEIAEYESGFESRALNKLSEGRFETVIPAPEQIRSAIFTAPLSVRGADGGKLLESFVSGWSRNETQRVVGAIRQGYFEGQTTSAILQAVRGTRANGFRDGVLAISNRNASAVVRTAVQHAASQAQQATWSANSDIVKRVQWVSTLDTRTTQQCQALDGREFPLDSGPRPPIHVNCRSATVAVLDQRYKFLDAGATRAARDDDGAGRVGANETYFSWLKKQPAAFQDSAIGPTRAKLLRDGGLTAERFSELSLNKNFMPLNLEEMRRLEPVAFEVAGV